MPNKYAGSCHRCGAKVPAGAGVYDQATRGAAHTSEAECKTTTKTWQRFQTSQAHAAMIAECDAAWEGGRRPLSTHVDAPAWGSLDGFGVTLAAHREAIRVTRHDVVIGEAPVPARPSGHDGPTNRAAAVQHQRDIVAVVRQIIATADQAVAR